MLRSSSTSTERIGATRYRPTIATPAISRSRSHCPAAFRARSTRVRRRPRVSKWRFKKAIHRETAFRASSLTLYTYSQIKYSLINGSNIVSTELSNLQNFYGLTKNGGGSPCYAPGNIPEANCQKNERRTKFRPLRSSSTPTTICFPTSSHLRACRRSSRSTAGIRHTQTSSHSA